MVDWALARLRTEEKTAEIFDVTLFTVQPQSDGLGPSHPRGDDPNRAPFEFLGTLDEQPSGDLLARHRASDPESLASNPYFEAVITAVTTGWAYMPRKLDFILRGSDTWLVMASARDGGNRRAFYVNRN